MVTPAPAVEVLGYITSLRLHRHQLCSVTHCKSPTGSSSPQIPLFCLCFDFPLCTASSSDSNTGHTCLSSCIYCTPTWKDVQTPHPNCWTSQKLFYPKVLAALIFCIQNHSQSDKNIVFVFIFKMIHRDTMGVKFHFKKKKFSVVFLLKSVINELKILMKQN